MALKNLAPQLFKICKKTAARWKICDWNLMNKANIFKSLKGFKISADFFNRIVTSICDDNLDLSDKIGIDPKNPLDL